MSTDRLPRFPRRTIHLDFHTGPAIPDVGAQFDPGEFGRTFAAAHVDSVTMFAKCHHGHLYHLTGRPERHPNLKPGLDLLGDQIEALHAHGIRAPIYLSVQVDEYAANSHPEWIALTEDLPEGILGGGGPGRDALGRGHHPPDLGCGDARVLQRHLPREGRERDRRPRQLGSLPLT